MALIKVCGFRVFHDASTLWNSEEWDQTALNPQPSVKPAVLALKALKHPTKNPQLHEPKTLGTLNPEPSSPKPETLNPKTLTPKPQNPKP